MHKVFMQEAIWPTPPSLYDYVLADGLMCYEYNKKLFQVTSIRGDGRLLIIPMIEKSLIPVGIKPLNVKTVAGSDPVPLLKNTVYIGNNHEPMFTIKASSQGGRPKIIQVFDVKKDQFGQVSSTSFGGDIVQAFIIAQRIMKELVDEHGNGLTKDMFYDKKNSFLGA